MLGNSLVAAQLAASQEGLSSMELVSWVWVLYFSSQNLKEDPIPKIGFEVIAAVSMKISIFCDITLCIPVKFNRGFGGTCRLHLHGRSINHEYVAPLSPGYRALYPTT
jgi:hypothetical protein